MYKNFFSLALNRFELTPDPAFLFPTKRHNEALAALYYGVRHHKGFIVLTGEVGTGKTLLLRWMPYVLRVKQLVQARGRRRNRGGAG
jgi:general secretion pathway protein A